jgi:16S rRNA processing protein RimM
VPRPRPPHPRVPDAAPAQQPRPAADRAGVTTPKRGPQPEPDPGFVAVGRVLAPFGLKGELKVQSLTDNPERFRPGARLWAGAQPVTIGTTREAQGYLYVTFRGIPDRTAADRFRHQILQVPESELPPLPPGEHYRYQLVGLSVVDRDGRAIGTLEEVIETGANDVYRVRAEDGTDLLLPALEDVIVSVDLAANRMVVDPPDWR